MALLPPPRCRRVCVSLLAVVATMLSLRAMTESERRAYVDWMNQSLPPVPTWVEWQKKTGALPPDFDALASANYLPDPFTFADGHPVKMPADWPKRRAEIQKLFQQHVIGRLPPKPKLDRIV